MFELDLTEPHPLLQIQALRRRIRPNHEKIPEIEDRLRKMSSGFQGEKTLHYFLSLIPEKQYHIFYGLRLPIGDSFFQIDFLLLSPKLIIISDAKNNSGTLTLDKMQMTQEYKDSVENYPNPVDQVNRHRILLENLFKKYEFPNIPIENLVVITRSSTKVVISPGYTEAQKKVCRAEDVLKRIQDLEKYHSKEIIDQKIIGKIKKLFLSKHTPLMGDMMKFFGLTIGDLISGVQCPNCFNFSMSFKRQQWDCSKCDTISKDAHLEAIIDYFLLIKPWFSNYEIREFLNLPSCRVTNYLLSLLNLPNKGNKRSRIYFPPNTSNYVSLKKTKTK